MFHVKHCLAGREVFRVSIAYKESFEKYETYVHVIDSLFSKIKDEYGACVNCKPGCDDCCYALFDLTLIEAMYINHHFNQRFHGDKKVKLLEKAGVVDRKIHKLKKSAYQQLKHGQDEINILGEMAMERIRCPLLNDNNECELYDKRPITCRLYGIPTSSYGTSHICGKSAFEKGAKYPTINMEKVYEQLYHFSLELSIQIKTKYSKLPEMMIPMSMALITEFNDEYLGVVNAEREKEV